MLEQTFFAKAFEKSANACEPSGGEEACGDGNGSTDTNFPQRNGFLAENIAGAMVEGLEERILEFDVLQKLVER